MNDLIYKNILLSSREIKVLAAYCGMETIRIMSEYRQEEMNPQEVNEVVFQLYKKGILCWNGENGYDMQSEVRSLFRDMKYATKELEVRAKSQKSPLHCFCNEEIIVAELSQNDADRIKVHRINPEEFQEELLERDIIPSSIRSGATSEKDAWKELGVNFQKEYSDILKNNSEQLKKMLDDTPELKAYVIVYNRLLNKEEKIILFLTAEKSGCITVLENGSVYTENLDEKNVQKLFGKQSLEGDDVV